MEPSNTESSGINAGPGTCENTSNQAFNRIYRENISAPIDTGPETPNPYPINIAKLDHGYIVEVGCQKMAVETTQKLIDKLTLYLNDPKKYHRLYWNSGL